MVVGLISFAQAAAAFAVAGLEDHRVAHTQGMGAREMREIAFQIHRVLTHRDDDKVIDETRAELADLCAKFAPYPD